MATDTFYPSTAAEDGYIPRDVSSEKWTTIRDNALGTSVEDSSSGNCCKIEASATTNRWASLGRGAFLFDTSALPDTATISSATFSVKITGKADDFTQTAALVGFSPASDTAFVTGDFDAFGTTRYADTDVAIADMVDESYSSWSLNSTGIAAISKTGITKFGVRLSGDVDNSEPTWSGGAISHFNVYYRENTGTSSDPKLEVTYTVPTSFKPQVIIF